MGSKGVAMERRVETGNYTAPDYPPQASEGRFRKINQGLIFFQTPPSF